MTEQRSSLTLDEPPAFMPRSLPGPRRATRAPTPLAKPGELFDAETVIYRLEEAGHTLLSLPQSGHTTKLRQTRHDFVRDALEAFAAPGEGRPTPSVPSPHRITRMDQAFSWIPLIPGDKVVLRRIVGCRCLVSPLTGRHLFSWRRGVWPVCSALTTKRSSAGTQVRSITLSQRSASINGRPRCGTPLGNALDRVHCNGRAATWRSESADHGVVGQPSVKHHVELMMIRTDRIATCGHMSCGIHSSRELHDAIGRREHHRVVLDSQHATDAISLVREFRATSRNDSRRPGEPATAVIPDTRAKHGHNGEPQS